MKASHKSGSQDYSMQLVLSRVSTFVLTVGVER
jgi:hypothetical protein